MSQRIHLLLPLLPFLVVAGCGSHIGEPGEWMPWDSIGGDLQPELAAPPSETPPRATLRLVTFNVEYGEDVEALARAVREDANLAAADVLLLQEIRSYPDEGSSRASRLAAALDMGYVYAPARRVDAGTHGLALLSRFPLENVAVMQLPYAALPGNGERRVALAADIPTAAGPLRIINVHLDTRMNADERVLQLRPAVIDAPPLAVVGGDFNSNPMVWAFDLAPEVGVSVVLDADQAPILDGYMATVGFSNPTASLGATVSFPGLAPHLDSIYVRGASGTAAAVERSVDVSDHWPVWLELRLGREATD